MNTIRKLPIGIQDFEYWRKENFLYVDKTQYVYQLAHYGKPYFLGRPRRFGKSLFLSTLKAYFEGKKEFFDGLKIAVEDLKWLPHIAALPPKNLKKTVYFSFFSSFFALFSQVKIVNYWISAIIFFKNVL